MLIIDDPKVVRHLAARMIYIAMIQAKEEGDADAFAWLMSDAPIYCDVLDLDITPERIQARLLDPKPLPRSSRVSV